MEKISDTITSVFHIAIKDKRPIACSGSDGAIVWSDVFGLGWRFGIAYNHNEWFAKVRLYLDHNHSQTEQDQAVVDVTLGDSPKDAKGHKQRTAVIKNFGHGQPALLGSWSPYDLSLHPYVSLSLTTKARMPQPVTDPLSSTTTALRQSMESGDFVDTKFYVFSAKRPGAKAGRPRVVYANNTGIGMVLPKTTSGTRQVNGLAPPFLVNMTGDQHINRDSILHEYDYEQDTDLDDEEEEDDLDSDAELYSHTVPGEFRKGSSTKPHIPGPTPGGSMDEEPPAYSVSSCRMVLVKGVAHKTWASYIYFRYTGQVFFLPLKSAQGSSGRRRNDFSQPPRCSPKSMYRLASKLGDDKMKELAFRAIKEGLSKHNVVDEAFSWFTAQYDDIAEYEVGKVFELRKASEVSLALKLQMKAVALGEKPWAEGVLIAILDMLNASEPPA